MVIVDGFPIDALLAGTVTYSGQVTSYPVESGTTKSDHVVHDLKSLEFTGIVSDSPFGDVANHETRRVDEVSSTVFGDMRPLPSAQAREVLIKIWEDKKWVSVEVPVAGPTGPAKWLFTDMVIESLTIPLGPEETKGAQQFTVSFKKMDVVTNARTVVRVEASTPQGKKKTNKATVGEAWRIDQTIIWRYSLFGPGGPIARPYPWTMINVIKPEAKSDLGKKNGVRWEYYYSGDSGTEVAFPYTDTPRRRLEGSELERFLADLKRDANEEVRKRYKQADPAAYESNEKFDKYRKRLGLPPNVDYDRVSPPQQPLTARYKAR